MSGAIDLAGATVLVTGASRGIGLAVARRFATANCQLHVLAEDPAVDAAARGLSELTGRPVRAHRCDITDGANVAAVVAGVGPITVLINNAGLERITPIEDAAPEVEQVFRRIIEINVIGTYLVTREVVKTMPDGGRIICTASVWGKSAVGGFSAYVASKHAVIGLVRSLARELGPRDIRVNAVCPGWVRTEASLRSLAVMAQRAATSEQAMLDAVLLAQALGGLMEPDDIADLYLFLASDLSRNITGQSLGIDRGEFPG